MVKHSVKETTSKSLIFPENIPRKRGNRRKVAIVLVSGIFLLCGYLFADGNQFLYLLSSTSCMVLTFGVLEIIVRFCSLFEELQHLKSRYNGEFVNLLCDVFSMSLLSSVILAGEGFIFAMILFTTHNNPIHITFNGNCISSLALLMSTLLLHKVLKLERSPLNSSLQFDELEGCDYGSGMAHSFFHGYLHIMLPHTGRGNDKGLKEFQQDYEARNRVKFDVYKLFILIPMSQNCPPSLESQFSPSVEPSKELESKEVDRAGVKNRNYKNSVYKINTKSGQKKYVTAEYATPVKTLWEVMKQNTPCAELYMKHRKEILLNFYLTLRKLLKEDETCCDLCEVIFYDDKNGKDGFRDVGDVILDRLRQIMKKND